jgi:hypothetical protein
MSQITADLFRVHLNKPFSVAEIPGMELVLESVEETQFDRPEHPSFALRFQGALTPMLEQQIYTLEATGLAAMGIFLVPIARDAGGMHYEAIFN